MELREYSSQLCMTLRYFKSLSTSYQGKMLNLTLFVYMIVYSTDFLVTFQHDTNTETLETCIEIVEI